MRFVNVSGATQDLPTVGDDGTRVEAGGEVDVTGDAAKGLAGNPAFERVQSKSSTEEK